MPFSLENSLAKLRVFLYRCWFEQHPARWLLLPFSLLFYLISFIRKALYQIGIKRSHHPSVPVIIVGNISIGGNGKTPVVLKLAKTLAENKCNPGILSRGYGGQCKHFPHRVSVVDSALQVGDEPKLMQLRGYCPVVIDPIRARGAHFLVEQGCDVIICDDGLQHYAMARDIEWVVMDKRNIGNGWLLPMGPLRELPNRLASVDAIIQNGLTDFHLAKPHAHLVYELALIPLRWVNVVDHNVTRGLAEFDAAVSVNSVTGESKKNIATHISALAGIGAPERFFDTLRSLGIAVQNEHAFADHHVFQREDIPQGLVLMTEKDAVKCVDIAHKNCWYLEVDARIPDKLLNKLLKQLASVNMELNRKIGDC